MKIRVTKKDIKNGVRESFTQCPIAKAVRRAGVCFYQINKGAVILHGETTSEGGHKIKLPASAKRFIGRFDTRNEVKPFMFNLKIK